MTTSVIRRFIKGFLGSGIASALVYLQSGVALHSVADLKQFGGALIVAFITGGLLALEKALSWDTTPQ